MEGLPVLQVSFALHAVRVLRIDLVPLHVTVDTFDHRARTFQVAEPVLSVRRAQGSDVLFDKGLEDAVDVRANGFAISSAVALNVQAVNRCRCGEERDAKHERQKEKTEDS